MTADDLASDAEEGDLVVCKCCGNLYKVLEVCYDISCGEVKVIVSLQSGSPDAHYGVAVDALWFDDIAKVYYPTITLLAE